MFKIEADCLYSKADLKKKLGGLCHIETFLRNVRPDILIKGVYRGKDILEAWDKRKAEKPEPGDYTGSHRETRSSSRSRGHGGKRPEMITTLDLKGF